MKPDWLDLPPATKAQGHIRLPGSKSISNRVLLLAALAEGRTKLRGVLAADDTEVMVQALRSLGVSLHSPAEGHWDIVGAPDGFPAPQAQLFLGNAGTAFRSLTAVLALRGGSYRLHGVPRMHERPIGDLVEALRAAGAQVTCLEKEGFPPLQVGARVRAPGAVVSVRGNVSSQYLTALLIAMAASGGGVRIAVDGELISRPYVDMTIALIRRFGVNVAEPEQNHFDVPVGARLRSPGTLEVEADASSASYFLAAGLLGGGPVRIEGVGRGSLQGDVAFANVIEALGGRVAMGDGWMESSGQRPLRAIDLDMIAIPDAAMTAAVLALFAPAPSVLRNIGSWRVKETDRIVAMATELRKLGATVAEGADFLRVEPPAGWGDVARGGPRVAIDTYDDHRMAMCFALAAFGPQPVRINDPGCVSKTFPGFFEAWWSVVQ